MVFRRGAACCPRLWTAQPPPRGQPQLRAGVVEAPPARPAEPQCTTLLPNLSCLEPQALPGQGGSSVGALCSFHMHPSLAETAPTSCIRAQRAELPKAQCPPHPLSSAEPVCKDTAIDTGVAQPEHSGPCVGGLGWLVPHPHDRQGAGGRGEGLAGGMPTAPAEGLTVSSGGRFPPLGAEAGDADRQMRQTRG